MKIVTRAHRWDQAVLYKVLDEGHKRGWAVTADAIPENGEAEVLRLHLAHHYEELMFTKSLDWESEREYRFVYLTDPDEPEIFIPIEESLCGVILGVDAPEAHVQSIKAACPEGVPVYQMSWNWGCYRRPHRVDP